MLRIIPLSWKKELTYLTDFHQRAGKNEGLWLKIIRELQIEFFPFAIELPAGLDHDFQTDRLNILTKHGVKIIHAFVLKFKFGLLHRNFQLDNGNELFFIGINTGTLRNLPFPDRPWARSAARRC